MKPSSLFTALFASVVVAFGQGPQKPPAPGLELSDPRVAEFGGVIETMRSGIELETRQRATNSIIIIHWIRTSNGLSDTYQIGGIPGYHSKERVEAFLSAFYSRSTFPKAGPDVPNVVICGNEWGAGNEIRRILTGYSKTFGFSVFIVPNWGFKTAKLIDEPEPRRSTLQRAFAMSAPVAPPTGK